MSRIGIHAARKLALGLGIGALAFGPGAGVAGAAKPPVASAAEPAEVVLSNGRTVSRWAYPQEGAIVRKTPSRAARAVGRLHFLTEDGQAEVYMALKKARVPRTGVTWIEVALPKRPNGVTGWVAASALGVLHVVRGRLVVRRSKLRATLYNGAGRAIWTAPGRHRPAVAADAGRPLLRAREAARDRQPDLRALRAGHQRLRADAHRLAGGRRRRHPRHRRAGAHPRADPSHGCMRLRNADITRLWHLISVGTPIDVV